MNNIIAHITTIFCFILLLAGLSNGQGESKNSDHVVNIVVHRNLLTMVNEFDAAASLDLWAKKWLVAWNENNDKKFDVTVKIIQNEDEIKELIDSKSILILAISTLDYIRYENVLDKEPLYVSGSFGDSFDQIYLVVSNNSNIKNLNDIKDKSIILPPGAHKQMALTWVNVLSKETFNLNASEVFKKIDYAESSGQTLLQVYFKKYDICIVDDNSYEIISDMNPQSTKELTILKTSFKFPHSVMLVLNTDDPEILKFVESRAEQLESNDYGRQLLKLFKVSSVIPFKEEHLENVRSLYKKNNNYYRK